MLTTGWQVEKAKIDAKGIQQDRTDRVGDVCSITYNAYTRKRESGKVSRERVRADLQKVSPARQRVESLILRIL
jgi:hypothetical protein